MERLSDFITDILTAVGALVIAATGMAAAIATARERAEQRKHKDQEKVKKLLELREKQIEWLLREIHERNKVLSRNGWDEPVPNSPYPEDPKEEDE